MRSNGGTGEFGGLEAQLNHLSIVLDMSITDPAGIVAIYDHRDHQLIQREALKRYANSDYIGLLSTADSDFKTAEIRDCDARTGAIKKEKEKTQADADKEKANWAKDRKQCGEKKGEHAENEITGDPPTSRWQKKRTEAGWVAWVER